MMKSNQILAVSFALVLGFFYSDQSKACMASRDPRANYFIAYERPYAGLFADGAAVKDIHPTIVDRCQGSGDFLMVALTLRTQKMNGRTGDISFTNKFKDDACKIVNNPFPVVQTYEDKSKVFQKQYALLRGCTFLDIVDIDDNQIDLPESQPASKVEVMGKNHIRVEGDFVYIKTHPYNRFAIGIGLKKECTRASSIRALGLEPGDLQALLNTYIAGDASGSTTDLTSVGSTRVRLALTAGSELMNVSSTEEPADVPSWPTTFKTGVEFGTLTIKPENDARSKLDFIPLVDNFSSERKCRGGICSSENSFQAPVAGLVELTDLSGARKKVVDSWYFGAAAPAQYQGFLESISKYVDPGLITIGRRYSIEMTMVNPTEDFLLFRSGLAQMLIDLSNLGSVAGLDIMQALGGVATITGMKSLNTLGAVGPDSGAIIQSALDEMNDYKGPQHWPAYIDNTCLGKTGICYSRGRTKFVKKIGAEFTIGELKEDLSYRLENMRIYSVDPANGYVQRQNVKTPKVDCTAWRTDD